MLRPHADPHILAPSCIYVYHARPLNWPVLLLVLLVSTIRRHSSGLVGCMLLRGLNYMVGITGVRVPGLRRNCLWTRTLPHSPAYDSVNCVGGEANRNGLLSVYLYGLQAMSQTLSTQ